MLIPNPKFEIENKWKENKNKKEMKIK